MRRWFLTSLCLLASCQNNVVLPEPVVPVPPVQPVNVEVIAPSEFYRSVRVAFRPSRQGVVLRYTFDGSDPTIDAPIADGAVELERTATVSVAAFADSLSPTPLGPVAHYDVHAWAEADLLVSTGLVLSPATGLRYAAFDPSLTTFESLLVSEPTSTGVTARVERLKPGGFIFEGWLKMPADGVYQWLASDGVRVDIHGSPVPAWIGLKAGWHPVRLLVLPGAELSVRCLGPGCPVDGTVAAERWGR